MNVEVAREPISLLEDYAQVPIAFEVRSFLEVTSVDERVELSGETGLVEPPFLKDYDSIHGNHPADWQKRFDLSRWAMFVARIEGRRVGGALIAFQTPEVEMLEGRSDLAVLWDIRVAPGMRRKGIGAALLRASEKWIVERGGSSLKVETQNINVAACRFYSRHGFVLRAANRFAYSDYPNEVQLIWYKELAAPLAT